MLYIHIPFCEKKCNYCDFISFNASNDIIQRYIENILSEIIHKSYLASTYEISSIYIGGGTPSAIDEKYIAFIMENLRKCYHISEDAEISIEVNPNSASFDKLKVYFDNGINRLSIGLQSTNELELKTLGRIHTYLDFINAYDNALHIGYKNINVDLINGIPYQTPESYKKSLKQVLMLSIKHLSVYNLIIEDNTPFKTMLAENEITLPLEVDLVKMDAITKELTEYYNLNKYEISNYAKNGFECRHNLGYWSDIPYIGFGLNSSSYFNGKRYKNTANINNYLSLNYKNYMQTSNQDAYYSEVKTIDDTEHMNEYVMLQFRKTSGINIDDFENTFKKDFEELYYKTIKYYQSLELLCKSDRHYFLSPKGLDISNKILADFMI